RFRGDRTTRAPEPLAAPGRVPGLPGGDREPERRGPTVSLSNRVRKLESTAEFPQLNGTAAEPVALTDEDRVRAVIYLGGLPDDHPDAAPRRTAAALLQRVRRRIHQP